MVPLGIIPGFNVFKDKEFSLSDRFQLVAVKTLHFKGFEEALSYGIIPTIPFAAHALSDQRVAGQELPQFATDILNAPVGMKDHLPANGLALDCHLESGYAGLLSAQSPAERPTDDFAYGQVQDGMVFCGDPDPDTYSFTPFQVL